MNTRFVQAMVSLGAVLWTLAVCASDRTWDGGSLIDSKWSSVTNWDGDVAVPGASDALFFGVSTRLAITNDLGAGLSFAGLTFASGAGAYSLLGDGITLGGTLTNASSNTQTINLPLALDATRTITSSSGAITLNGQVSGAGGWTKEGSSRVTLSASNAYDGATLITTGVVSVTHGWALGSTNGTTTVNTLGRARLELSGGITVAEPLTFSGGNNQSYCLQNVSGSNTLTGVINTSGGRYYVNGGTTLVIAGGMTGSPFFVLNGSGTIYVRTTPFKLGTGSDYYSDDSSLTIFDVASNAWGQLTIAKGTVRMNVKDALPPGATVRLGLSYGSWGTFDLNGFDQTTTRLYADSGTTNSPGRSLTSAKPAMLTINQNLASSLLDTKMTGAVGLIKAGTGTLIVSNTTSTTTGNMIVSTGTLVVAIANSLGFSTNVTVDGGTLELRTGEGIADAATLSIADGAVVKIATNLTETVDRLFINGTQRDSGTYGANGNASTYDNVHFSGGGILFVLSNPPIVPTNYTWDATGPDTYLNTASNWVGDATPELGGTSHVIFGTDGSTATVNTNASLYGITFTRDANFTLANGDGALTLGLGGIFAAAPAATARAYAIAADTTLSVNQIWSVTNVSGGTTLTVSGSVGDGTNTLGFTKLGNGTLVLSGSNTFDGVITNWCGGIQVSSSNALGSTAGGTVINTAGPSSAWLSFNGGITLAEPLTFIGGAANGGCLNNNGGTNTVSGLITTAGGRFVAAGGTVLNITGGMVAPTSPQVVFNASGTINITTTPLHFGTGIFWTDSGGLTVLGVASNTWGRLTLTGGTLRTDVANALPTNSILQVGGIWYNPHCTLNLNGFNQTVGELSRAEPTPGKIAITSAVPATLTVNQSTASRYDGMFAGYVSLLKLGTGTLTITNPATSTAGSFIVSNGTLVVADNGTLGNNSTNIVVAGNGMLALSNSVTIADSAVVTMPSDGVSTAKINLASGVNESVGWLFFGNKMKRAGVYGSSSSPAPLANQDNTHFSGSGVLTVLHDKSGTLIRMQ